MVSTDSTGSHVGFSGITLKCSWFAYILSEYVKIITLLKLVATRVKSVYVKILVNLFMDYVNKIS